jgi:hypothetical protein
MWASAWISHNYIIVMKYMNFSFRNSIAIKGRNYGYEVKSEENKAENLLTGRKSLS